MRRPQTHIQFISSLGAMLCVLGGLDSFPLAAQEFQVEPIFETSIHPGADVDSVAVWRDRRQPERSLLFVSSKQHDRLEVYRAATGLPHDVPFIGGNLNSSAPGQFNRPNAVWVLYDVPWKGSFRDILLTTEQLNSRVQVFSLPDLTYLSSFGVGEIERGHGLAAYEDGSSFYVYVADSQANNDAKIKKYRLLETDEGFGAELVRAFGQTAGPGLLYGGVESILADPAYDRLHVCGDEAPGRPEVIVYDLEGNYTGTNYGDPQFEFEQEGIALYETGRDQGYLIIADQYEPSQPAEYEVFDRVTLDSLGHFQSPPSSRLVTQLTDGVTLCQMPLPGLPNGAFYASDNDINVNAYDWTDIAEAMGLEIVALDRPSLLSGDPGAEPAPVAGQRALWHEDGSWWAVLAGAGTIGIYRLEDGAFAYQQRVDFGSPEQVAVARCGEELLVLASGTAARLYRFGYEAQVRRHRPSGGPLVLGAVASREFALACDGEGRAWVASVEGGELRVLASAAGNRGVWPPEGVALGAASPVVPELIPFGGGLTVLWAAGSGLLASFHANGAPPGAWSTPQRFADGSAGVGPVGSLTGAASGSALLAAFAREGGGGAIWVEQGGGPWAAKADLPPGALDPALSVDAAGGEIRLFFAEATGPSRRILVQSAAGSDRPFGSPERAIGWPGVSCGPPLSTQAAPAGARDLIVAAGGSDGAIRFARYRLPSPVDGTPPITLQHDPAPVPGIEQEVQALSFRIVDDHAGVDRPSLRVLVDGRPVTAEVRGVPRNYLVKVPLEAPMGSTVSIRIEARDLADPPNVMTPFAYTVAISGAGGEAFRRADANGDGGIDVSDPIFTLFYLFVGLSPPPCLKSADSNDDGELNITDALRTLGFLFGGDAPPPAPYPACGVDPTLDGLTCENRDRPCF
jgi:myo-inositol-hexaphosphate 3-phosphohydrolase